MRRTLVATVVIVAGLVAAPTSAEEPGASAPGGEHWYGFVSMEGMGSHKLPDGGQFTNHDKYVLNAPEPTDDAKDPAPGRLNITIDTVETHPDPDPATDGCWTLRQVWSGVGVVDAALSVQSNVGGKHGDNYIVHVDATAPVQVNIDTFYGGVVGGEPCSAGDSTSYANLSGWVVIHSGKNVDGRFRNGPNETGLRLNDQTCEVVSECTDFSAHNHFPTKIRSEWSLSARECTGYSRAVNLGQQDTLFVFSPCQTKSLSSRVNFLQEISGVPKICDYAYVKRLNTACDGYKAVTRIQWSQTDFFMAAATREDACGVWVVDRADWRPPKVRPAEGPDSIEVVWISVGGHQLVKTAKGTVSVGCP